MLQSRRASCSAVDHHHSQVRTKENAAETVIAMEKIENGNREAPTWAAFRGKFFSLAKYMNKSPPIPGMMSPGSRSPGSRSPSNRSPTNRSPQSRSPASRSPGSRSPTRRTPSLNLKSPTGCPPSMRSPTSGVSTPIRSPTQPYQRSSPIPRVSPTSQAQKNSPTQTSQRGNVASRRGSYKKSSKETFSSSGEAENPPSAMKPAVIGKKIRKGLKKGLSLDSPEEWNPHEATGTPTGSGSPGTPSGGRKVKLKIRGSPVEQLLEMTHLDDAWSLALAARKPRTGSYHGTTSTPSSEVEAPKRHSFSSVSGNSGIVVSNNDLEFLLRGKNTLTLPGLPSTPAPLIPTQTNPKVRGRSQSIAACAHSMQPDLTSGNPIMGPIIRRTDCDYVSASGITTLEDQEEEEEENEEGDSENKEEGESNLQKKLVWDSSGSTVDVGLLGSAIEKYLKTSNQNVDDELRPPISSLQVK